MTNTPIAIDYSDHLPEQKTVESMIKPLEWSDPHEADDSCLYNHVVANTPFGRFRITWKGWKEYPSYDVDEFPWTDDSAYFLVNEFTLDQAKQKIEEEYQRRVRECLI